MPNLIDRLPAPLATRLRTRFGTQFVKFAAVAVVSLGSSEIALGLFIGPLHLTGGVSGVCAAMVGAVVSYVLSRKAWGRKGRPNVLRETLPFWLVSVGAWLVLGLATKLGLLIVHTHHLHHLQKDMVVGGIYFVANCFTFAARFLIFHYVLFADGGRGGTRGGRPRMAQPAAGLIETESLSPVTVSASDDAADPLG